jgi:hypothetical protein
MHLVVARSHYQALSYAQFVDGPTWNGPHDHHLHAPQGRFSSFTNAASLRGSKSSQLGFQHFAGTVFGENTELDNFFWNVVER